MVPDTPDLPPAKQLFRHAWIAGALTCLGVGIIGLSVLRLASPQATILSYLTTSITSAVVSGLFVFGVMSLRMVVTRNARKRQKQEHTSQFRALRQRHERALRTYASYELDPQLQLQFPELHDVRLPHVAAIAKALANAQRFAELNANLCGHTVQTVDGERSEATTASALRDYERSVSALERALTTAIKVESTKTLDAYKSFPP